MGDKPNDLMNAPLPDPATTMDNWTGKRKFTFPPTIMDTFADGPRFPGATEPETKKPKAKKRKGGKRTKRKRPKRKSRRRL